MDLRNARLAKGWTLEKVADLIGARTAMTVSRHERGIDYPRPIYVERYLAIYGTTISEMELRATFAKAKRAKPARVAA